jgi:hypothetical protein
MRPVAVIATGTLAIAGCGTTDRKPTDQDDANQIIRVLEMARTALLDNRSHEVCGLLTAHGRTRALGFQVDFAEEGTPVPSKDPRLPQTCEAIVEHEWSEARRAGGAISWPIDLRHVRFSVLSVDGSTANAQLKVDKPYGPVVEFTLRKTPSGWRIDDSDAVPGGY